MYTSWKLLCCPLAFGLRLCLVKESYFLHLEDLSFHSIPNSTNSERIFNFFSLSLWLVRKNLLPVWNLKGQNVNKLTWWEEREWNLPLKLVMFTLVPMFSLEPPLNTDTKLSTSILRGWLLWRHNDVIMMALSQQKWGN